MKKLLIIMAVVFTFVSCKDDITDCDCIKTTYQVPKIKVSHPGFDYYAIGSDQLTKILGVEKVICQEPTKSYLPWDIGSTNGVTQYKLGVISYAGEYSLVYYRITCN